jgi:hypothetical protein
MAAYELFGRSILKHSCDSWLTTSPKVITSPTSFAMHVTRQSSARTSDAAVLKNICHVSSWPADPELLNCRSIALLNSNLTGRSLEKTLETTDSHILFSSVVDIQEAAISGILHPAVQPIWAYMSLMRTAPFRTHNELTARFVMCLVARIHNVRPEIAAMRYYTCNDVFRFDSTICLRGVTRPFVTGVVQGYLSAAK